MLEVVIDSDGKLDDIDHSLTPCGEGPLVGSFLLFDDSRNIHVSTLASRVVHLPVLDAAFKVREWLKPPRAEDLVT